MKFRENVPLAPFTTFGIGGPARYFAEPTTEEDVVSAVRWSPEQGVPLFILGGGSNLLISDAGFPGLVLRVSLQGVECSDDGASRIYRVAAGESWDSFVERTVQEGCVGIECLAGIPGTVGGTPVQNVGAYGQEVSETIERVRVLDLESLLFHEMSAAECGFAYRTSIFNTTARGRYLVLRVDFRLLTAGAPNLKYADVRRAFPPDSHPSPVDVAAKVREIRRSKGMLLVEGDPDCRSAGSFFKNPIVTITEYSTLNARLGIQPPSYPVGDGLVKLPAAWLIEQAGFPKGFALGRAGISTRHTLALVNLGGATAVEMLALHDAIAAQVQAKFGIRLQMEPVTVGF